MSPPARSGTGRARPGTGRAGRVSHRQAATELAGRDPVIADLVRQVGYPVVPVPRQSHFASLVRSITHQQLAGAAARTIHGRVVAALGGEVTPERILATAPQTLRAAGLSGNKLASLCDLAGKVVDGTVVLDARGLARESDEEVVARLSTVRGIGVWTAQMFLIFHLRRLDVWPTGDLGVRKGYAVAWRVPLPSPRALAELGDPFRPYRSVAAWYCWRAAELPREAAAEDAASPSRT